MSEKNNPGGNFLGVVGFIAGCVTAYNMTENVIVTIIFGFIGGGLGVSVGNWLWKVLMFIVSVILIIVNTGIRQAIFQGVKEGVRQNIETPYTPSPRVTTPVPQVTTPKPSVESTDSFTSGWRICNKSSEKKIYVAYLYYDGKEWVRKGWRHIKRNECSIILNRLDNRYVYYYAEGGGYRWSGKKEFCVHTTEKFSLRGEVENCPEGYKLRKFKRVDTKGNERFTTNLGD